MFEALTEEFLFKTSMPWQAILARLTGALVFCGLIGFEREVEQRPAGLRTHMLIGLAAAVYTLMMYELIAQMEDAGDHIRMDPIRLLEAVTSGVAFLAAGLIVFAQGQVRGLTTGASMWLAASVGVACGMGLWSIALMTTLLALIVVRLIKLGEKKAGTYDHEKGDF